MKNICIKAIAIIMSHFLVTLAFAQSISDDHKDIFEERLANALTLSMKPDVKNQEINLTIDKLLQFSKDYPNSKFAKDAKYLIKLISFTGAVNRRDKESSLKLLKEMEEIVDFYPNGILDELTCKKWKEILGDKSSAVVYIPFKDILLYMRGFMGFWFKDYESTIENLSLLKDKLDFSRDNTGILAEEVYLPLALSFKLTNRLDKYNEIAKEAVEKFPNTHLEQSMQKVLDKNKSQ